MAEYDLIERNKIFEKVTELYRYSNGDMHIAYRKLLDYILDMPAADVQPIVYAHKTINVGRRSYCSNCGKLAIMEDFCSKCGAKVRDDDTNGY